MDVFKNPFFENQTYFTQDETSVLSSIHFNKALVVSTKGSGERGFLNHFKKMGSRCDFFLEIQQFPLLSPLVDFAKKCIDQNKTYDQVIAVGGGSVLDSAKVLALLLKSDRVVLDQVNTNAILDGLKNQSAAVNLISIPTTPGTGSEVTPYATLWDLENKKKLSVQHSLIVPQVSILSTAYFKTLPFENILYSMLDSLTQCFESLWNKNYTPKIYDYAAKGIIELILTLNQISILAHDDERKKCLLEGRAGSIIRSGFLSGLAISQTKTALCHSMSYPLTAHYKVPHGLACGVFLPAVLDFNSSTDLDPLLLRASGFESVAKLKSHLIDLYKKLDLLNRLRQYGVTEEKIMNISSEMLTPGRSDNNFRFVDVGLTRDIIHQTFANLETGI